MLQAETKQEYISPMLFEEPRFTAEEYDMAGVVLGEWAASSGETPHDDKVNAAIEIASNRRAASGYVMSYFKHCLDDSLSKSLGESEYVVQRLKRMSSTLRKLNPGRRNGPLRLTEIQDIAGCRIVVDETVKASALAGFLRDNFSMSRGFRFRRETDYIKKPKKDGYRSHHLIYEFDSKIENFRVFNGFLVELQIRSFWQHAWATAVEIIDFIGDMEMKFGRGTPPWDRFFLLLAAVDAVIDRAQPVRGCPSDITEIKEELSILRRHPDITRLFLALSDPAQQVMDKRSEEPYYRLMVLDGTLKQVVVSEFSGIIYFANTIWFASYIV